MAIKVTSTSGHTSYHILEISMDTDSDVNSLPVDCTQGSTATAISSGNVYKINSQGMWVMQPYSSGDSSGGGTTGAAGTSVVNVYLNDNYELICTLSNGTSINAGAVPGGEPGAKGDDGVSVTGSVITIDGHLQLTLSDGTTIDAGSVQSLLPQPVSISRVSIDTDGNLICDFTDGSSQNAGSIIPFMPECKCCCGGGSTSPDEDQEEEDTELEQIDIVSGNDAGLTKESTSEYQVDAIHGNVADLSGTPGATNFEYNLITGGTSE